MHVRRSMDAYMLMDVPLQTCALNTSSLEHASEDKNVLMFVLCACIYADKKSYIHAHRQTCRQFKHIRMYIHRLRIASKSLYVYVKA
jgi:hypothetical protein